MPTPLLLRIVAALISLAAVVTTARAATGAAAEYVGGTDATLESRSGRLDTTDDTFLAFRSRGREVHVPYDKVNLLEYGQNTGRRVVMAVVVSPLFLLSKKRQHFLTVGFTDPKGKQQALVFRVDKSKIRSVLVALEARTGLKVEFQDGEARKAGKG